MDDLIIEHGDDLIDLYAGRVEEPWKHAHMIQELQDPTSELSKTAEEIRRIARTNIDISKIPGLEEVTIFEEKEKQ
jgi:hypothetical protein